MKQFQFRKNGLAIELFADEADVSSGALKCDNLFLVFPGMPNGFARDYFSKNIQMGSAFLYVNYLGSYLSDGICTPENCRKSVKDAVEFAKKKSGKDLMSDKRVTFSYEKLFIIGYSFAGNSILTSRIKTNDVAGITLISPLIFLHKEEVGKVLAPDSCSHFYQTNKLKLQFIRRCMENVWRGIEKKEWSDYFQGKDKKSRIGDALRFSKIFVVHGQADKEVNIGFSEYFASKFHVALKKIPDGGHSKDLIGLNEIIKSMANQ